MPYQGSGKAYVFYFIQAMIKVAVDLGFNESEAELLVNQTFMGLVAIQNSYSLFNEGWITKVASKVASKGGTTEIALRVFEKGMLKQLLLKL